MAVKRYKTEFPGVRYKEHPTRKHGVKFDRYYSLVYRLNGKVIEEGIGWASQGMTAQKASLELGKLKEAQRLGQGPQTLREKRDGEQERRATEEIRKKEEKIDSLTFREVFTNHYVIETERNKNKTSVKRERELCILWIYPVIGDLPLKDISLHHIETLKNRMMDAGRAAATVRYCLAVVRQIFNFASDHDLYDGVSPTRKVKKPIVDNRRTRFLSREEAQMILDALKERSIEVHNMALLSLYTGARLGEITGICWSDVDMKSRTLTFRDTKNKDTRHARMTKQVFEMLFALPRGKGNELVFPGRGNAKILRISRTFDRTVQSLKLNDDIADRRQKIVFHSLRHSFASWARKSGADLFTLQRLLGHKTPSMVARYAHVDDETIDKVMAGIEKSAGAVDTKVEEKEAVMTTKTQRVMTVVRGKKINRKAE